MAELTIETRLEGGVPVVGLAGELDAYHAPRLRERLDATLSPEQPSLVLNLLDVGYIDSTGLGVLVAARKRAELHGGTLRLVVGDGAVQRTLKITGLLTVFPIFDTEAAALAANE
jgi:anti-sigma B factor antagonist